MNIQNSKKKKKKEEYTNQAINNAHHEWMDQERPYHTHTQ